MSGNCLNGEWYVLFQMMGIIKNLANKLFPVVTGFAVLKFVVKCQLWN